jgi:hypothetical protein
VPRKLSLRAFSIPIRAQRATCCSLRYRKTQIQGTSPTALAAFSL